MLDLQRLADDLKRLRQSKFKSSRAFATKSGISREIARKIESGDRSPELWEFIAWIKTCGADPVVWLLQYLTEDHRRIREMDRELNRIFLQAIKIPSRREALEALFKSWADADALADRDDL